MNANQIAGIVPALVFPAATLVQLVRIARARSVADVSVATWLLFGFANLAIYVYAERYGEWQAILGMLVTAVLDFAIVGLALAACGRKRQPRDAASASLDPASGDFAWRFDTGRRTGPADRSLASQFAGAGDSASCRTNDRGAR